MIYEPGMKIPEDSNAYRGFVIHSIANNGWCKIYHPNNVKNGNIEEAMTSVRIHWIAGSETEYQFFTKASKGNYTLPSG